MSKAVNTACYVLNRENIRHKLNKTPYKLLKGKTFNLSHLHMFDCKCFVLNNGKSNLKKFDSKVNEGIFLGCSIIRKEFRIFNRRALLVNESMHVIFYESISPSSPSHIIEEDTSKPRNENLSLEDNEEVRSSLPIDNGDVHRVTFKRKSYETHL